MGVPGFAMGQQARLSGVSTNGTIRPGFPIFGSSDEGAKGHCFDQAISAPCGLSIDERQGPEAGDRRSNAKRSAVLTCVGRTYHMVGDIFRRPGGRNPGHADAVSTGGPRRPLISATMPAKTARGSAASANWNTA